MLKTFENDKLLGIILGWWKTLDLHRGDRAELRRANSIASVILCPSYQRLYKRLVDAGWLHARKYIAQDDNLAAAIALIAHVDVKSYQEKRPPVKAMGEKIADRPAVSELRFLRLLDSPDIESLFIGLRRLLPLMEKSRFDVMLLVDDVMMWGDSVKKEWAYGYEWPDQD